MRLRTKFSLFTVCAMLVTSGALLALSFFTYRTALQPNADLAQNRLLMEWKMVCFESLHEHTPKLMNRYAALLGPSQGVDYAYFVDASGRITAHTFGRFVGKGVEQWRKANTLGAREDSVQVWLKDRRAGSAVEGFSVRGGHDSFREAVLVPFYQLLLAAGILAALVVIVSGAVADRMTRRFALLEAAGREIEKGNFSVRVSESGSDEFADLGVAFNRMAGRLAELERIRDEFVYAVSHDLKAPVSAMIMYAGHLLEADPDSASIHPRHRKILQTIEDNGRRMLIYVSNVLDVAKIKAGKLILKNRPISVAESVFASVSLFSLLAQKQKISLEVRVPQGLPPAHADPEHLQQVLANLISNALKFTPSGGSVVVAALSKGDRVELSVTDTGRGMPAALLSRIFKPFPNAEPEPGAPVRPVRGTGLGLYIVSQAVAAMDGSVTVESEAGKGTRFTVNLPRSNGNG